MRILLTGATGYLGSRLCKALTMSGHDVVALHLNRADSFMIPIDSSRIDKVYLSERKLRDILDAYHPDGVIHTATIYGRLNEGLKQMLDVNVKFPVEIMLLCEEFGVKFFINTDTILGKSVNAYSLTKCHVVDWMGYFCDKVKMINMKLDHFYGPFDRNTKFIACMFEKMRRNEPTIDLTEGTQKRDFIYIDDIVAAYMAVVGHLDEISCGNVAQFEVGTDIRTSIRTLVMKIKDLTGSTSQLNFGAVPLRRNEMLDYQIDTTALRALGWTPRVTIDEGLRTIAEMEKNK